MVPHLIIYEFNIGVQFRKEKKIKNKKTHAYLIGFRHHPFPFLCRENPLYGNIEKRAS